MNLQGSHVFIDLDGTMIDSRARYYKVAQFALERTALWCKANNSSFCARLISQQEFWSLKMNRVPDLEIAMRFGLTQAQAERYLLYVKHLANHSLLENHNCPIAQVDQALGTLKRSGAKLSLLTLRPQRTAEQILIKHGWSVAFDAVHGLPDGMMQTSSNVKMKTQLLEEVISARANLVLDKSWVIGDTEADVIAGQTFGLNTAALTSGMRSHAYLTELNPTDIWPNLLEASYGITRFAYSSPSKSAAPRSRTNLITRGC